MHLKQEVTLSNRIKEMPLACMSVPADDVAAMTKPATARPAITPPFVVPDQTANTKMATCNTQETLMMHEVRDAILTRCCHCQDQQRVAPTATCCDRKVPDSISGAFHMLLIRWTAVHLISCHFDPSTGVGQRLLTVPYTELMSKSVRPVPYAFATAKKGTMTANTRT